MENRFFLPLAVLALIPGSVQAQSYQRTATIRGGGNGSEGKCTIEVVVDGAAQVEIRGTSANLRNLNGQPPQWRRFECTSPMPQNPQGFRFAGVDGRGSQRLLRGPENGSPVVIEISDPDNGAEGYTFDLMWGNGNYSSDDRRYAPNQGNPNPGYPNPGYPNQGPPPNVGRRDDRGGRFGTDQAVQICQDNIRQQAVSRYRAGDVRFRQTTIDDNPGRADWVIGTVELRSPRQPDQVMKFSCSVDFQSGRVRSASMEPFYAEGGRGNSGFRGDGDRRGDSRAIQNCQRAAQQRVQDQGFGQVTFGDVRVDQDRGDRVRGDLRASGRNGSQWFGFTCTVEARDGDVRSVDVFRRER